MSWQKGMMGVPHKRNIPWQDLMARLAKSMGHRPDLKKTEWYKLILGKTYASMPEMEDTVQAIIKMENVEFGIRIMEKFFTLPSIPAPDTLPRALRKVRQELVDSNRVQIQPAHDAEVMSWGEMLALAEGKAGNYKSGLEVRFGRILRKRFSNLNWEENTQISVTGRYVSPDFLCRRIGLSIEIDSLEWHQDRESFISDRQKARALQLAGYMHLQFSGPELSVSGGLDLAMGDVDLAIKKLTKK